MEYRVEALAAAAGIAVDTLRFYQTRGLLPKPGRRGRVAIYGPGHLQRLRRIRSLVEQGFSLAQIGRVLEGDEQGPAAEPLLAALADRPPDYGSLVEGGLPSYEDPIVEKHGLAGKSASRAHCGQY